MFDDPSGSARDLEMEHEESRIVLPVTREPAMMALDSLAAGEDFLPVLETPGRCELFLPAWCRLHVPNTTTTTSCKGGQHYESD